jgi:hypothetical protein
VWVVVAADAAVLLQVRVPGGMSGLKEILVLKTGEM